MFGKKIFQYVFINITLHTTHYTLHTTHYTLHTTHYTLHTTHYTLHTEQRICVCVCTYKKYILLPFFFFVPGGLLMANCC